MVVSTRVPSWLRPCIWGSGFVLLCVSFVLLVWVGLFSGSQCQCCLPTSHLTCLRYYAPPLSPALFYVLDLTRLGWRMFWFSESTLSPQLSFSLLPYLALALMDDFPVLASSLVPLQLLAGSFLVVKFFFVLMSYFPCAESGWFSWSPVLFPHLFPRLSSYLGLANFFGNQLCFPNCRPTMLVVIEVLPLAWCCW